MGRIFTFAKLEKIITFKNPYYMFDTEVKAVIPRKELQKLLDNTNEKYIEIPLYLKDKGTPNISKSYFALNRQSKNYIS